jgi:lipoyl(octanoyl) transferase
MTGRDWRLLLDGYADGPWNMAVDEALLLEGPDGGVPTLRLYTWRPHTLSLGANQRATAGIDWARLEQDGYGVVRRPTGGRAILHAQELTYSVTAPAPPGGTLAAYLWLAEGVRAGLSAAGVALDLERSRKPRGMGIETRDPCFTAAGRYELVAGGRKVVGSAQRRRDGWLMQHGSILLGPEHLKLPRYLGSPDPAAEETALAWATVDCSTLLGRSLEAAELTGPLVEGFARALDIRLIPGELTAAERERADRLRTHRFTNLLWTRKGLRAERDDLMSEDERRG